MKHKNRLDNLIQRVGAKAALILLGGLLFVGCGDSKKEGNAQGDESSSKSEEQASKQAKEDLYTALVSRVGLGNVGGNMRTKDSFLRICNDAVVTIPAIEKGLAGKGSEAENAQYKEWAGEVKSGAGAGALENDDNGLHTLSYWKKVRESILGVFADSKEAKKANPGLHEGHLAESISAALDKDILKKVACKAADDDVAKAKALGTDLKDETSKAVSLVAELMEKAKAFCDHFKEGDSSKFSKDTFAKADATINEIAVLAKAKGDIKVEARGNALKLDGNTERDFGDAEKAAKDKLVEKLKAEIDTLKGLSPNAKDGE